jgi:pimeloyl-ACP methyl ester carboxylesterase
VAALYAARHPDRISRLVQIGPVPPRSGAPYASPEESAAALREEAAARLGRFREEGLTERDPRGYCRAFWEAYAPLYVANEEAMPVFLRQAEATCQWPNERPVAFLRTLEGVLGSLDAYDWRPLASEILAPTLVIHGREDKAAPVEGGREWAAANPNARFVPLERAGHFVWIDRPDDTLDLIRTFLAEPERGAPPPDATSGAAERGGPG